MDRRKVITSGASLAAGLSAAMTATGAANKVAATRSKVLPPGTLAPRGRFQRMERLPYLDLESRQDFLQSFRSFANREMSQAAAKRADDLLAEKGVDRASVTSGAQAASLLSQDPLIQASARAWISCQQLSWRGLAEEFAGNADKYLAEMEAVDKSGPGSLELNPNLALPDYTRHEIHIQPGGYVGSPFAGHLYHYGTNGFYQGRNFNDELHVGAANKLPVPKDGKILRILDIGTGIGQLAMALKERFPNAEVWGIDVGGPMIRYAHLRAVERNLAVSFAQRLAEDTHFPDNHFDLVTSYIMFHEVAPEATRKVVQEAWRITRPGGIFYPIDFKLTGAPRRTPYQYYRQWWDHRWNNEVWSLKFRQNGLPDLIRRAGFDLNESAPEALAGFGILNATKPTTAA